MLVLSRKVGERLVINEKIVIIVVGIAGGRIKLGIEAPSDIPIRREELIALRPEQPQQKT